VPVSVSVSVPGFLTRLQHDHPLHPAHVPHPASRGKADGRGETDNGLRLAFSNFQDRAPTRPEKTRQIGKQAAHQNEAVTAAVESRRRVMTDLDRHSPDIIRRHVGKVRYDQIPRRSDR
jgi:hypothetical protein